MNSQKLTAVIAFRNEGRWLKDTIDSIRATTSCHIPIILVDDNSDDWYDYIGLAKKYDCTYVRSSERIGSAGGKDIGASLVQTEFFVFFDAHMKVFHPNWDVRLVELLEKHPDSIISARTVPMEEQNGQMVVKSDEFSDYEGIHYGSYVSFNPAFEFDPKWIDEPTQADDDGLIATPCVFGAVYGFSKAWWDRLLGYKGLYIYGLEESFISMKCWIAGGQCFVVEDWGVGHLYRKSRTPDIYVSPRVVDCNRLLLEYFYLDDATAETACNNLKERLGDERYNESLELFNQQLATMSKIKQYFFCSVAVKGGVEEFCKLNNRFAAE